jgi:hypothetical protein
MLQAVNSWLSPWQPSFDPRTHHVALGEVSLLSFANSHSTPPSKKTTQFTAIFSYYFDFLRPFTAKYHHRTTEMPAINAKLPGEKIYFLK